MGLVDQIYLNHLTRLGYDVPENIVTDFGDGGIKGTMYENRALFGQQLTAHLNDMNWLGKSDWEAAEIQAIGWMQLSGMYGTPNTGGDVVDAFARNTRRISMEVDPGEGSPWAQKFGEDYGALDDAAKISINDEVTARAIDLVNKRNGVSLGNVVHGTGGWELYQNPSTVQQAIASKDTAIKVAAELGYLLNQTQVWVNAPKEVTKNPDHFAIDILETGGDTLRQTDGLRNLFEAIVESEPYSLVRGFQPVTNDGKSGLRIIINKQAIADARKNNKGIFKNQKEVQTYLADWFSTELDGILKNLDIDAEVDMMEADLTILENKWDEVPDGGNYKIHFGGQPGENAATGATDIDSDRGELENLFSDLITKAKAGSAGPS